MFEIIGWLVFIVPLIYSSIMVFYVTVPTFGDAFFTMQWYYRILGVVLWVILLAVWLWWFSFITVNV